MHRFFYSCTFLFVSLLLSGQTGYIATDTSYNSGVTIILGKASENAKYCIVKTRGKIMTYSPDELTSYGIPDYKSFASKEVDLHGNREKFFLEQLVKGKTSLYYMKEGNRSLFFLEKDSSGLILLARRRSAGSEKNYRDVLEESTADLPEISGEVRYFAYNRGSLRRLVEQYNTGTCRPFATQRLGIMAGYGPMALHAPPNGIIPDAENILFNADPALAIGIFYEIPLQGSDFTFRPELFCSNSSFGWKDIDMGGSVVSYDIIMNITSLRVPLMVRYTMPGRRAKPFVNGGASLSYALENHSTAYIFKVNNNLVEITDVVKTPLVAAKQLGVEGGAGLQIPFYRHKSIDLEVRYSRLWGKSSLFDSSVFQCITGFNF